MKILCVEDLRKINPNEVRNEFKKYPYDILVELLKCKYATIGDMVAYALEDALILNNNECFSILKKAIISGRISTKISKIRTINILFYCGKIYPESKEIYKKLLLDKNNDVATESLIGLAFHQDKNCLSLINEWKDTIKKKESPLYKGALIAIEALENEDPFIAFPFYADRNDVWKLDKKKFGHRIGPNAKGMDFQNESECKKYSRYLTP